MQVPRLAKGHFVASATIKRKTISPFISSMMTSCSVTFEYNKRNWFHEILIHV